jgi:hypothetical protein
VRAGRRGREKGRAVMLKDYARTGIEVPCFYGTRQTERRLLCHWQSKPAG